MKGIGLKIAGGALLLAASMPAEIAFPADTKTPSPQSCKPGTRQAAVYSASGRCSVLGRNIYRTTAEAGLGDEPIASIETGSGTRVVVCGIDENFSLECRESPFSIKNDRPSRPWTFLQVATSSFDVECRPKETEIAISGNTRRIGPCVRLGPGKYENARNLNLSTADYTLISEREKLLRDLRKGGTLLVKSHRNHVETGRKIQAKICAKENFQDELEGKCANLRPGGSADGILGSITVREYCRPEPNQAGVFELPGAFGACTIRDVGEYLTAKSVGVGGGLGSSLLLGSGVQARTCTEENLRGDCVDVKGPGIVDRLVGSLVVRAVPPPAQ